MLETEPTVHTEAGVPLIVGTAVALPVSFEVAVTVKLLWSAADAGAPVKLTDGATFEAATCSEALAAL
jgi:hypothetical protein